MESTSNFPGNCWYNSSFHSWCLGRKYSLCCCKRSYAASRTKLHNIPEDFHPFQYPLPGWLWWGPHPRLTRIFKPNSCPSSFWASGHGPLPITSISCVRELHRCHLHRQVDISPSFSSWEIPRDCSCKTAYGLSTLSQNADAGGSFNIGRSSSQGNNGRDGPDDSRRKGKERDSEDPPARRATVIQIQNPLDQTVAMTRVPSFRSVSAPTSFSVAYLFKHFKSEEHSRLRYEFTLGLIVFPLQFSRGHLNRRTPPQFATCIIEFTELRTTNMSKIWNTIISSLTFESMRRRMSSSIFLKHGHCLRLNTIPSQNLWKVEEKLEYPSVRRSLLITPKSNNWQQWKPHWRTIYQHWKISKCFEDNVYEYQGRYPVDLPSRRSMRTRFRARSISRATSLCAHHVWRAWGNPTSAFRLSECRNTHLVLDYDYPFSSWW